MYLVDQPPNSIFTESELARLAAYRAAVAAGFYTDWDGSEAPDISRTPPTKTDLPQDSSGEPEPGGVTNL
jgi:hypothetical protein